MTNHCLKLNENKTKIIELLPCHNAEPRLVSDLHFDTNCTLNLPTPFVKSLGVILDVQLNLDKHINKVVSTCYYNLRNLGRIGSKLSKELKIQLVHSMIFSHIDYCNALYFNLPEYLPRKLTKVLYSAVRFVFGFYGSALRMHMLPYLKQLHILPIKYRIEFKIALLTHKCLHGNAPDYLKELIFSRSFSSRYNLRVNDDKWLLQNSSQLNYVKSESMFSFASPKIWNSLPLSLREIESVSLFKAHLKSPFFSMAFEDVATVGK